MIVPTVTPKMDTTPVVQTVAGRQYGRWAVQFRAANLAQAAHRDVVLERSRKRRDELQRLRDAGLLTDAEYARLAAQA